MLDAKQQALKLIESLPDDCSLEDIHYRLYFCEKVEKGIQAIAEGRVVSQNDAEARVLFPNSPASRSGN